MKTLAQRYNEKARELMPTHPDLLVDNRLTSASEIDETVFRRSEYLGGMAAVILRIVT